MTYSEKDLKENLIEFVNDGAYWERTDEKGGQHHLSQVSGQIGEEKHLVLKSSDWVKGSRVLILRGLPYSPNNSEARHHDREMRILGKKR